MTALVPETGVAVTEPAPDDDVLAGAVLADDVLADVLVEEISIDGMCGVY
jgi:mycofactocin precursor